MSVTMTWPQMNALPPALREQLAAALMSGKKAHALSPFFFSMVCDCVLFGLLTAQVVHWVQVKDEKERRANRWLVTWVYFINVALTVFLLAWTTTNFITTYGKYMQFMSMTYRSWAYVLDALVRTPVSAFYGERAWKAVGRNMAFAGIVGLLCVTAIGLAITLKFVSAVNYATPLFDKILYTWLGLHLVLDLVITCTLTVTLIRQRAKASKRTQWIVSRIVIMTMETQLPPTLFSIAYLVIFWQLKATTWPAFFSFSGKVSGVCMLAVVNHKYSMRRKIEDSTEHSGRLPVHVVTDDMPMTPLSPYSFKDANVASRG